MLQLLARGGVTGGEAREALRVLVVHTIGFVAYAVQPGFGDEDEPARAAELAVNFEAGFNWLLESPRRPALRSPRILLCHPQSKSPLLRDDGWA